MNKYALQSLVVFLLFIHVSCSQDKKQQSSLLDIEVGHVSESKELNSCGCSFYWPEDENKENPESIFTSDLANELWMNINGKDVRLKLVKSTESLENSKKGGRYYEIYQYGTITIKIDYLVTWTCEADAPASESCEVTYYDLDITLSQNKKEKRIHAKGFCGC